MKDARALGAAALAAALIVLLAGVSYGQGAGAQGESGQSELAPDQAASPAERPDAPGAPQGTPAPAPRPQAEAVSPGEAAAETAPEAAPVPPAEPAGAPDESPPPEEAPEAPAQTPEPEEAPEAPATAPAPAGDPDAEAPAEAPVPAEPPVPEQLAEDDAGLAACLGRLRTFGTAFERVDPVSDTPDNGVDACGIVNPLRVDEIVPGVALEPAGIMRCATAAALAEWVQTFVLPASAVLPERGRLAAVGQASSYVCRRIGGGGDLSQHAFGNAVDVVAFRFADGPAIPVEPREREGTAAEAFQRTARASACLFFTTVLGPGQEEHDDHLHLDIEPRGSDYRLCQ